MDPDPTDPVDPGDGDGQGDGSGDGGGGQQPPAPIDTPGSVVTGSSVSNGVTNFSTIVFLHGDIPTVDATDSYDEGQRVEKIAPAGNTIYVYDAFGQLAAQYNTFGSVFACSTCYVTIDHLGSVRMVTDRNGAVVTRHDYLPFGEEIQGSSPSSEVEQRFTGQIRDAETGMDFFNARYFTAPLGRFNSTDPHTLTAVHLINPQRWNMYAYGLDNPLTYVDPNGKDAIVVDFANKAVGMGHLGIIAVDQNGTATYGDFGPNVSLTPLWPGAYGVKTLNAKIAFGSDGLPTKSSLEAVTSEVSSIDKQATKSIRLDYFKTSPADTAALKNYLNNANKQQLNKQTPWYAIGHYDCRDFCLAGLHSANVARTFNPGVFSTPNSIIGELSGLANANYFGDTGTGTVVTSTITFGSPGDVSPGAGSSAGNSGAGNDPGPVPPEDMGGPF
jgi:RHS repeat-associated protein